MLRDQLDVGSMPLDVPQIIEFSAANSGALVPVGKFYSIAAATPQEAARVIDAIFRGHFAIRPFPDEGDDYAVGAEW